MKPQAKGSNLTQLHRMAQKFAGKVDSYKFNAKAIPEAAVSVLLDRCKLSFED